MVDNDYISRASAVQCARDIANDFKNEGLAEEAGGADTVGDWLEDFPAADVRPVVLCRDCIYAPTAPDDGIESGFDLEWPHDEWPNDNPCPCKCGDKWYSRKPAPDFFCANGVKRSGNE